MVAAEATRRALMLATAAAPLAYATPAAAAHPDADLLQLGQQYDALNTTVSAFGADLDACRDEADALAPPFPETLRVTTQDRAAFGFISADLWSAWNVDQLRGELRSLKRRATLYGHEGARWTMERASQIIADFDAICEASDARLAATRFRAVDRAYDEALTDCDAAADQIAAARATSVAGLRVKAKLAQAHRNPPASDAPFEERLVWSLLSDLLSLEEPA